MQDTVTLIRPAAPHELPELARFVVEAYSEFEAGLTAKNWATMQGNLHRAVMNPGSGLPLVADMGGAIGGFVMYFPPGRSDGVLFPREWASIRLLGVGRSIRGRGLGRELMRECLDRARADGAATFGLHTSELMDTARAMYARMGFRVVRELERRLGIRYWLFALDLTPTATDNEMGPFHCLSSGRSRIEEAE